MKYLIYFTFSFVILVSCSKNDVNLEKIYAYRTIIVYMAADNDLSDDAWNNLKEIQNGYEDMGANLIVFIDPINDVPHILKIANEGNKRIKDYSEFNSVDANQMRQVISDIIGLYPSESYGLVLWSHGTSWLPEGMQLKSFGDDQGRQMDIIDLANALPIKFDFILLDACLMGSIEVVYELRNRAEYIIASPTEILYLGFPYEPIIPELLKVEPDLKQVANIYFSFFNQLSGAFNSASISLINTRELERLAMLTKQIITCRIFQTQTFDYSSVQRLDVYEKPYTFDFLDFMQKAFTEKETEQLIEQLNNTVLYKAHTSEFLSLYTIESFCGLSCYIPDHDESLHYYYRNLNWYKDSGFDQLFSQK